MSDVLFAGGLLVMAAALAYMLYLMSGGRRLWGPRRGEPFCGHPFERTWGLHLESWQCPKCLTYFHLEMYEDGVRRWTMDR